MHQHAPRWLGLPVHGRIAHWTGSSTAESTIATFAPARLPDDRAALRVGGELNVATQFLVDRDGTIYRLLADDRLARHTIGLNHLAIGVENVGDGDLGGTTASPLTDAQVAANAALVRYLAGRYPIELLLGHFEAPKTVGTPYYTELLVGYHTEKSDPGPAFMAAVREKVVDLGLKAP